MTPESAAPLHQAGDQGSARAEKGASQTRGAREAPGIGSLERQEPSPAPAHKPESRTHRRALRSAVLSLAARHSERGIWGDCSRLPGPCFLAPLRLLTPDPRLQLVELQERRAEDAD